MHLAQEVARRNITVNNIAPGFIDTEMVQKMTDEQKMAILKRIPLKKMGLPEDVAQASLFLASDKSHYITGHTLHVNGGMYMN